MKKTIKPAVVEEATYTSDFSGKFFGENAPVDIDISCNYGSENDGSKHTLHLDDKDCKQLFAYLRMVMTKKALKAFNRSFPSDEGKQGRKVPMRRIP